jgi:hypothetical protein
MNLVVPCQRDQRAPAAVQRQTVHRQVAVDPVGLETDAFAPTGNRIDGRGLVRGVGWGEVPQFPWGEDARSNKNNKSRFRPLQYNVIAYLASRWRLTSLTTPQIL